MPSITRKPRLSREERRRELGESLLAAVERLFEAGQSFTTLSVEDLITEADISRSTFYLHFQDKGALLLELFDNVTHQLSVAASKWWELPADATRDDLREALRALIDNYHDHRLVMVAMTDTATFDSRVRDEFDFVMERRVAEMGASLAARQTEGAVRPEIDVGTASEWITWMTSRGLHQTIGLGREMTERHLESMATIIWNALYDGTR